MRKGNSIAPLLRRCAGTVLVLAGILPAGVTVTSHVDGFTVSWELENLSPRAVEVDGVRYIAWQFNECVFTVVPGSPRVPIIAGSLPLAGPAADVSCTPDIGWQESERTGIPLPNPYRHILPGTEADPEYEYRPDPDVYSVSALYPSAAVAWETATAGTPVLFYRIRPVRVDPVTGRTELARSGSVRFRISYPRFRTAAAPDSAMDWYDRTGKWFKIPVASEALYRITYAQLAAVDALPDSGVLAKIALYEKGAGVPILISGEDDGTFDPGDHILFYGSVDYDSTVLYDHYTDTTVYWLKVGGTADGNCMALRQSPAAGGVPVTTSVSDRYFEKDSLTYTNRYDDITLRYYWHRIAYPPASVGLAFDLFNPVTTDSVDLTVRLRGMTSVSSVNPDHHLTLTLNSTSLPDFSGDGDGAFTYSVRVAGNTLVHGTNILTVHLPGDTPAGEVDAVYLDWFRVQARQQTAAHGDRFLLRATADTDSAMQRFTVDSLQSPAVLMYRKDVGCLVTGYTVDTLGSSLYRAGFADTVTAHAAWLVCGESAVETVDILIPDTLADLRQASLEGDYLIITAPELAGEAQRLADWRETYNGYSARVVFFNDIVDEFNYGIFNPEAIRTYIKYAWDSWSTRPQYVCILGDACWDYKRAEYDQVNIVPSVGNPANDNFFACVDGTDIVPDLFVGRLPADDIAQARQSIDKILAYEADSAGGAWRGSFVFLNGGQTAQERSSFSANTNSIIGSYVTASDYFTRTTVIDKQLDDCVWDENADTILSAFNQGAVWVNFAGHGGSWTWDCMFSYSNLSGLTNRTMLPFITSMTCHTGRFAEPGLECFGESFVEDAPSGGLAFFGTTGWGYILGDYYLSKYLYQAVLEKGYTDLGRAIAAAKTSLYGSFGTMYRELVEYYSLIGDPAVRLKIPDRPDLTLQPGTLSCTPDVPFESTDVTVSLVPHNLGYACSCSVAVDLYYDMPGDAGHLIGAVTVPPESLGREYSLTWSVPPGRGSYTLYAVVDGDNDVAEWDEDNNVFSRELVIYTEPLVAVRPFDKAVIAATAPALVSAAGIWSADSLDYFFELDTVPACTGGAVIRSGAVRSAGNAAVFSPGVLAQGKTYYWRTRLYNRVQYSQWSVPVSFTVDTAVTGIRWAEYCEGQFSSDSAGTGVTLVPAGVRLARTVDSVDCAHLDEGATLPMVTSKTSHTDARNLIGGAFDTIVPSEAENFIFGIQDSFQLAVVDLGQVRQLRRIISHHYGGKGDREVWSYFSISSSADSLDFVQWGEVGPFASPDNNISDVVGYESDEDIPVRYILFNYGLNSPDYGGSGSRIVETYAYRGRYGWTGDLYSTPVGPAVSWDGATFNAVSGSTAAITVDIQGWDAGNGTWTSLSGFTGLAADSAVPLAGIDAAAYPQLRLVGRLATADRFSTPRLADWEVAFTPAPEYVIDHFGVPAGSLRVGDTVRIAYRIRNAGYSSEDSCLVRLSAAETGTTLVLADMYIPGDTGLVAGSLAWVPDSAGSRILVLTVDPDSQLAEIHRGNNRAAVPVTIVPVSGMEDHSVWETQPNLLVCRSCPEPGRAVFMISGRPAYSYRLAVIDGTGRCVRHWDHVSGGTELIWDGRTRSGRICPAGVYYMLLHGQNGSSSVRFMLER